jgi:glucose/arabinose dehydrogenase
MADPVFILNKEVVANETSGVVLETISRAGSLVGDIVVTYGLTSDTATAPDDFIGSSGTIVIPAGTKQVTVPIQIVDDAIGEPTERFAFSLISADGGTIWTPRTSRISILDNETPAPPPEQEPPLASNYEMSQIPLVTGLNQPVRFVISSIDPAKVYVAEKPGIIRLADLASGEVSTVLDISGQVNESGERGLLDIALHPDFPNNPYIYAFVVIDPADAAGRTGLDAADGASNRYSQVIRYTADAASGYTTVVPGSGVVLLGGAGQSLGDISGAGTQNFTDPAYANAPASDQYINPNHAVPVINGFKQDYLKVDSTSHAGGHLSFGPDGALYVSVGDGTSFNYADPHAPNVQSLDGLNGKILRVDPMTGRGLTDNPFVTSDVSLDSNRSKIFQLGLRNPFSMTFDPEGRLIIADTGWNSYEEINVGGPGANFGWPWFEGADGGVSRPTPGFRTFADAIAFYDAVNAGGAVVTAPYRGFSHDSADPGFQVQTITSGEVVYTGSVYPASLLNNFIFADFTGGRVYAVNTQNSADLKYLYSAPGLAPIDFVQGPDGYIYYSDLTTGEIGRLSIAEKSFPTPGTTTIGSGSGFMVTDSPPTGETITIAPDDANPVVLNSNATIVATSGDHLVFIGGSFNTVTLKGGTETVLAFQGNNTITTGAGNDTIRFAGTGNVVDAGGGSNRLEDSGGNNTIVVPAPNQGFIDVFGYVLQQGDLFDFRQALGSTSWDGTPGSIGNFLQVAMAGGDATVGMRSSVDTPFSDIALLRDSGSLTVGDLLARSIV